MQSGFPIIGDKPAEIEQKMSLTINQVILDKLPNGNYLIQADYKKFTFEKKSPDIDQKYDSDASDNMQWLDDLLKGMTKLHLKYEVSSSGVVSNLTGFEDYTKNVDLNVKLFHVIRDFGTDQVIVQMFNYFPKTKVEIGEKWMTTATLPDLNNLKYDINYTLTEVSPENIKLEMMAKIKFISEKPVVQFNKEVKIEETGVQKGNVILNPINNMPLSSFVTQNMDMLISTTDTITKTKEVAQMKLLFKTSVKLVK